MINSIVYYLIIISRVMYDKQIINQITNQISFLGDVIKH
jgi:hypothetical protein